MDKMLHYSILKESSKLTEWTMNCYEAKFFTNVNTYRHWRIRQPTDSKHNEYDAQRLCQFQRIIFLLLHLRGQGLQLEKYTIIVVKYHKWKRITNNVQCGLLIKYKLLLDICINILNEKTYQNFACFRIEEYLVITNYHNSSWYTNHTCTEDRV